MRKLVERFLKPGKFIFSFFLTFSGESIWHWLSSQFCLQEQTYKKCCHHWFTWPTRQTSNAASKASLAVVHVYTLYASSTLTMSYHIQIHLPFKVPLSLIIFLSAQIAVQCLKVITGSGADVVGKGKMKRSVSYFKGSMFFFYSFFLYIQQKLINYCTNVILHIHLSSFSSNPVNPH